MRKNNPQTKSKIISAAWRLFYERGFENTSVEEIVELSGTSKGSFYHYFEGKDALLGTLSTLFDEEWLKSYYRLARGGKNYDRFVIVEF